MGTKQADSGVTAVVRLRACANIVPSGMTASVMKDDLRVLLAGYAKAVRALRWFTHEHECCVGVAEDALATARRLGMEGSDGD